MDVLLRLGASYCYPSFVQELVVYASILAKTWSTSVANAMLMWVSTSLTFADSKCLIFYYLSGDKVYRSTI